MTSTKSIFIEIFDLLNSFLFLLPGKTGSLIRWLLLEYRFNKVGLGSSSFESGISITGAEKINKNTKKTV